jgi:cytochrome P450 / NADPH-cytochrome P450 reductase
MILNESLRLYPTAPQFTLYAKENLVLGGKYQIKKKQNVAILLSQLHRDKKAWGEDAEEFRPERFADARKIPHDAYKPFGNGQRACIGMQFALHEATLLIGMILQHFELIDHSNYQLKIKQIMTLKPDHFTMRVQLQGDLLLFDTFFANVKKIFNISKKGLRWFAAIALKI